MFAKRTFQWRPPGKMQAEAGLRQRFEVFHAAELRHTDPGAVGQFQQQALDELLVGFAGELLELFRKYFRIDLKGVDQTCAFLPGVVLDRVALKVAATSQVSEEMPDRSQVCMGRVVAPAQFLPALVEVTF